MKYVSFVFVVLIIWGCKEKQTSKTISKNQPVPKIDIANRISIKKIGELRFRRSYVVEGNTLSLNKLKKISQDKPSYYYSSASDSFFLKKFRNAGYLNNNYELLTTKLTSFKLFNIEKSDTSFHLMDAAHKKIYCQIKKADSIYYYDLFAIDSVQTAIYKIDNKFILPGLQFRTLDIIAGGFEEVILLDAYYIINGDNFDFFIYEIKYN